MCIVKSLFVCNPCQSSPSLTILVPLWFIIIISFVFLYLTKDYFQVSFKLKLILYLRMIFACLRVYSLGMKNINSSKQSVYWPTFYYHFMTLRVKSGDIFWGEGLSLCFFLLRRPSATCMKTRQAFPIYQLLRASLLTPGFI